MVKKIIAQYVETGKLISMVCVFPLSENSYTNIELQQDFAQEIALYLLEYKYPQKLVKMYKNKELDYFIMKITKIQATSNNCKRNIRIFCPDRGSSSQPTAE